MAIKNREQIFSEIKRVKRERANTERLLRERNSELRLMHKVLDDIDNLENMSYDEVALMRSKLMTLREIAAKDKESEEDIKAVDEVVEIIDNIIIIRKTADRFLRQLARQERIEKRRAAIQTRTVDETKCVTCHKRPRHFGDYCKRCVPEDQRPKGKVM